MSDILDAVILLINTNWASPPVKPNTIMKMFETKFANLSENEGILVYQHSEMREPFGLGAQTYMQKYGVSCDIMTATSRARLIEIRDALIRCFRIELRDNKKWVVVKSVTDLSNDLRLLYRMVVDVEYTTWENLV